MALLIGREELLGCWWRPSQMKGMASIAYMPQAVITRMLHYGKNSSINFTP